MEHEITAEEDFEEVIDPSFKENEIGKTTTKGMRYPCIILDGRIKIDAALVGTIRTLSKPVVKVTRGKEEVLFQGQEQNIALYLKADGKLNMIGLLTASGVRAIIDLLGSLDGVTGFLDENTELTGNNVLILRGF